MTSPADDPIERAVSAAEQDLALARDALADVQKSVVRWQAEVDRCERQLGLLEKHRLPQPDALFPEPASAQSSANGAVNRKAGSHR